MYTWRKGRRHTTLRELGSPSNPGNTGIPTRPGRGLHHLLPERKAGCTVRDVGVIPPGWAISQRSLISSQSQTKTIKKVSALALGFLND